MLEVMDDFALSSPPCTVKLNSKHHVWLNQYCWDTNTNTQNRKMTLPGDPKPLTVSPLEGFAHGLLVICKTS
ncbi:hypothetical protein Pcinc_024916 [Petrolisthes cinctipes]|uniref:Uncharacterized protein n=1 Tax=Petrolisthes cinctipes TaxID=88211 RepID=A0AAE1FBN9_PETCI|nr:hypothetical protein Pcinc_024916 [Petrolisthes cinctipes]